VWLVPAALGAVAVVAITVSARWAAAAVVALLLVVAAARWLTRRERREALAVRSWPVDLALLLSLAVGIGVLALSPGV
jgi:uncharacterized membrane protein YfcA